MVRAPAMSPRLMRIAASSTSTSLWISGSPASSVSTRCTASSISCNGVRCWARVRSKGSCSPKIDKVKALTRSARCFCSSALCASLRATPACQRATNRPRRQRQHDRARCADHQAIAAHEAAGAVGEGIRPREHRALVEQALQVLRQLARRRVAARRFGVQCLEGDQVEIAGHRPPARAARSDSASRPRSRSSIVPGRTITSLPSSATRTLSGRASR